MAQLTVLPSTGMLLSAASIKCPTVQLLMIIQASHFVSIYPMQVANNIPQKL